jgi:hypothetical protein
LERGRRQGDPSWGPYGQFFVRGPEDAVLCIVASGADEDDEAAQGWEHVSVSAPRRTPTWAEMCFVKDLFWDEEETVLQFHPPKSQYVPMPPSILVGIKSLCTLTQDEARIVNKIVGRTP